MENPVKTIRTTTPEEILVKNAIQRLAAENGDTITLSIDHVVNVKCSRHSIDRQKKQKTVEVDLTQLEHVSVSHGATVGICVRLIFDGQMYASCGEQAEAVIDWAKEVKETELSKKIKPFPSVYFQQVLEKVKVLDGEIMLA